MTVSEPIINDTDRLELKDAAEALKAHKSSILRWTHMGLLHCGIRRSNGRRFWTGKELKRFWKSMM